MRLVRLSESIGAEHVERAVRQVDDPHDAEHQRESAGGEEDQQAVLQAVEQLDEDEFHRAAEYVREVGMCDASTQYDAAEFAALRRSRRATAASFDGSHSQIAETSGLPASRAAS